MNKTKLFSLIFIFGILFGLCSLTQINLNKEQDVENDEIAETKNDFYKDKNPKCSLLWNLNPFVIDDNGGGNYNWNEAKDQPWCRFENGVYIIENVTINGNNAATCLEIRDSSAEFIIRNCTFFNSGAGTEDAGIKLLYTDNGQLINNNCSFNNNYGIYLRFSEHNIVEGNTFANNTNNGISLSYADFSDVHDNLIVNHLRPWWSHGIYMHYADNCTVYKNEVSNNFYGILLQSSNNNTFKENVITSNINSGIDIDSQSDDNRFYKNVFVDQTPHVEDDGTDNRWDNGQMGNYWNDYGGPDNDGDGIGDINYTIYDSGPTPVANDTKPLFRSPLYEGERIHIDDSGVSNHTWARTSLLTFWCTGSGIKTDPYVIKDLEIDCGGSGSGILIGNSSVYFKIENCKVYNSGSSGSDAGIKLFKANNGTLNNNNCSSNGDYGIFLSECNNTIVSMNTANKNSKHGVYLHFSNYTFILNNHKTINFNAFCGVLLNNSHHNSIINNTINENSEHGIALYNSHYNNISKNEYTIDGNAFYGIFLNGSCYNNITRNNITNNKIGICLNKSNYNTIAENNLLYNDQAIVYNDCTVNYEYNNILSLGGGGVPGGVDDDDDDNDGDGKDELQIDITFLIIIISIGIIAIGSLVITKRVKKSRPKFKQMDKKIKQKELEIEKLEPEREEVTEDDILVSKEKSRLKIKEMDIKLKQKEVEIEKLEPGREVVTEDDILISKEKHFCLVHKGAIEGYTYICPDCGTYYCLRCLDAIKEIENACWSCGKPLDPSKPVKHVEKKDDIKVKPIDKKFKPKKAPKSLKDLKK